MPNYSAGQSLDSSLGSADFSVQNDWGGGFTGQVTITNQSAAAAAGWQIVITTADHLTGNWNSNLVSQGNGTYVLSNAAWNGALAAGGSTTLGFNFDQASDSAPFSVALVQMGNAVLGADPPAPTIPASGGANSAGTPAASTPGASAVLAVTNDWGSGFTGQVTVTNTGTTAISGWTVELDTLGQMTGEWNSSLVSHSNGAYLLSNDANNGTLAPGASTTFGFNMDRASNPAIAVGVSALTGPAGAVSTSGPTSGGSTPTPTGTGSTAGSGTATGTSVPANTATASLAVTNDWGSGFTGQVTVTNTGSTAISGWQVAMNTAGHVTGYWNSALVSQANGTTVLSNDGNDGTLAPGASVTFGFNMDRAPGSPAIAVGVSQVTGAGGTTVIPPAAPTNGGSTAPTTPSGSIVLGVSEDAYAGDAQFTVTVDGVQAGGTYTATASHAAGQSGQVTLAGSYGAGPHTVAVTFVNDAYGGPGLDRNLYVDSVTQGGVTQAVTQGLYTQNAQTSFVTPGTPAGSGTNPTSGGGAGTSTPGTATGHFQYLGVNLSGGEFGISNPTNGGYNIGTYGTDYTFPTHSEIDYYASEGLNVIRLPFSWERLQPTPGGQLDSTQLGYIDDVVHYAATKGVSVVLDAHNYGYGYGNLIGSDATTDSDYASLWSQLATHYGAQSNVLFGLMNEPHVQSAQDWVQPTNDAIAAIRGAGATQEILVAGTDWTGGDSWLSLGNAAIFAPQVIDPLHNMAFEIHQYSDADGSGSSTAVVSPTIAEDRLQSVTQWAEQTGNKLFLGEFGSGQDAASLTNLHNMLDYMSQHTDAWQGGTEWGGGPWWGNYGFALDPQNGVTTPQVAMLSQYAPTHTV